MTAARYVYAVGRALDATDLAGLAGIDGSEVRRIVHRDLAAVVSAAPIRTRKANACADFARLDHRINSRRSSSVRTSSAFGRPALCTRTPYQLAHGFATQDTRTVPAGSQYHVGPAPAGSCPGFRRAMRRVIRA